MHTPRVERNEAPQLINAALGIWLMLSALFWEHGPLHLYNTVLTGLLMLVASTATVLGVRYARWVNTGLAVWLFSSTAFLPYADGRTVFNQLVVASLALFVSFVPPPALTEYHGAGMTPRG
jgi:hypothetical protein